MREIPVTWGIVFRFWLSQLWRMIVYVFLGAMLLGVVVGVIGGIMGLDQETITGIATLLGAVWGFILGFVIIKQLLNLRTKKWRVAIIEI